MYNDKVEQCMQDVNNLQQAERTMVALLLTEIRTATPFPGKRRLRALADDIIACQRAADAADRALKIEQNGTDL